MSTEAPTPTDEAIMWLAANVDIRQVIERAFGLWYAASGENPDEAVPVGWVGGQLRNELPLKMDLALYKLQETEDPTGTIGHYFYPKERT